MDQKTAKVQIRLRFYAVSLEPSLHLQNMNKDEDSDQNLDF